MSCVEHSAEGPAYASHAASEDGRTSASAQPPSRQDIAEFMLTYSAHLPHPLLDTDASEKEVKGTTQTSLTTTNAVVRFRGVPAPTSRLLAPYLYTGVDYALVLSACFPTRCVDLSLLNWSATPLVSQRQGNLRVFCDAARALALPDAPLSALHPELLQSSPACVVAHLKVQHWLYSLSLRFVPAREHDAAALRIAHQHLQLGEPYLKRRRGESAPPHRDSADTCCAVDACAPISASDLLRCCGPVLAPLPPFIQVQARTSSDSTAQADKGAASLSASHKAEGEESRSSHDGEGATRAAKQKPWLNYSKPWLLPSLKAAEAKKAASEAAAAKREQEERERNPRYTAFVGQSNNVREQYSLSTAAVAEKRTQLQAIKSFVVHEIMEGKTLEFKDVVARLRECA